MKNSRISWSAALTIGIALLATPALAMNHSHQGHDMSGGMDLGEMMQMGGMEHGQPGMIMLGEEIKDGIKAMFHLMPVDRSALPPGDGTTHHLMVMLNDAATGQTIDKGTVAVKITSPDGKESAPVRMVGMQGHFGADVGLDKVGTWHFRMAAKPADGKVRQFHSHHVVK
ncbi:MAG: hypothetical protein R2940_06155 [Syntrophotaleaceae bacterium]